MGSIPESMLETRKSSKPVRGRWYSVFALSAAYLIDSMESFTTQFLWPYIYPVLGVPVANLAILQSVNRAISAVTGPVWGYIADRFSRKWLLVIMTGIWGLWTSAKGFADTFSQLLLFSVLAGIGLTVLEGAALSILSDLFDRETRGRAIGIRIGAGFTGSAIAIFVLGSIADSNPEAWRIGFIVMGILSFVSGIFLLGMKEPPRGSAEPELSDVVTVETAPKIEFNLLPQLFRNRSWLIILVCEICDFIGFGVIASWAMTWMYELNFGTSIQMAMMLLMVGTILGHLTFGWVSDYFDKRHPKRARLTIGMIGFVLNLVASIGFIGFGDRGIGYLSGFGLLFGLTFALKGTGARLPLQQNVLPPELRATGRSMIIWSSSLLEAAALALSGWLLNRLGEDLQHMMLILVPGPIFLATLFWTGLFRTYPRDMEALHRQLSDLREDITAG